jgi:hypothetical protein
MGGDEACATNSMSCAERADLGRRDRRPVWRARALMPNVVRFLSRLFMRTIAQRVRRWVEELGSRTPIRERGDDIGHQPTASHHVAH